MISSKQTTLTLLLLLLLLSSVGASPVRCFYEITPDDVITLRDALGRIMKPPYNASFCNDTSQLVKGLCGDQTDSLYALAESIYVEQPFIDYAPYIFNALEHSPEDAELFAQANFITRRNNDCWDLLGAKTYLQLSLIRIDSGASHFYLQSKRTLADLSLIDDSLVLNCIKLLEFDKTYPRQLEQSFNWYFGKLAERGNYTKALRRMEGMVHNYVEGGRGSVLRVLPKSETLLQQEIDSYIWRINDGHYHQKSFFRQPLISQLNAIALSRKPNSPRLHYIASAIPASTEKDRQERLSSYLRALQLGYKGGSVYKHLCDLLKKVEDYSAALETLDSILVYVDSLVKPGSEDWLSIHKRRIDLAGYARKSAAVVESYERISKYKDYIHNTSAVTHAYIDLNQLDNAYRYMKKEIKNTESHEYLYLQWHYGITVSWLTLIMGKEKECRQVEALYSSPSYIAPKPTDVRRYNKEDSLSFSSVLMNIGHSYVLEEHGDPSFEKAVGYYGRGLEIYQRHSNTTGEDFLNGIKNDFIELRARGLTVLYDEKSVLKALRERSR